MPEDEFKLRAIFEIDEKSIREIQQKLSEGLSIGTAGLKDVVDNVASGDIGSVTDTLKDTVGKLSDVAGEDGFLGLQGIGQKMTSIFGEKGMGGLSEIGSKIAPGMGKAMSGIMKMGEAGAQIATKGASAIASAIGGSGTGAAAGAVIGSIAPGVGTMIGAAVGVAMGPILEDVLGPLMDFAKQASPMIETIMALWQTTMMLFIRPFADFMMLVLMPVMIIIMKYIAIPFYQYIYPKLMDVLKLIEPYLPDLANVIIVILGVLFLFIVAFGGPLWGLVMTVIMLLALGVVLWRLYEKLMNWLFDVIPQVIDFIRDVIWEKGIRVAIDWIVKIAVGVWEFLSKIPGFIWEKAIKPAVDFILEKVDMVINFLSPIVMGIWNFLSMLVNTIVDFVTNLVSWLWEAVVKPIAEDIERIMTALWGVVEALFGPVVAVVRVIWEWLVGKLSLVIDFLRDTLKSVWETIKGIWDWLVFGVENAIGFVKSKLQDVYDTLSSVWTWISDILNGAIEYLKTKLGNLWDDVKGIPGSIWDKIVSGLTTIKTTIIDPIISGVEEFIGDAIEVIQDIVDIATDIYDKVVDTIVTTLERAADGIDDLWDILANVKTAITDLNPFGKAMYIPGSGGMMNVAGSSPQRETTINIHQTVDGYVDPRQLAESASRQLIGLSERVIRG